MTGPGTISHPRTAPRDVALIDMLDRLLQGGVVVQGEIVLAAAGIDLVALDLRLLISAIDKLQES